MTLGKQQCQDIVRDESDHLALGAVDLEKQKEHAETICQELSQNKTQISVSSYLLYFKSVNTVTYNYEIEWISGCEQTPSAILADEPLIGSEINCSTLWIGDCTACELPIAHEYSLHSLYLELMPRISRLRGQP